MDQSYTDEGLGLTVASTKMLRVSMGCFHAPWYDKDSWLSSCQLRTQVRSAGTYRGTCTVLGGGL